MQKRGNRSSLPLCRMRGPGVLLPDQRCSRTAASGESAMTVVTPNDSSSAPKLSSMSWQEISVAVDVSRQCRYCAQIDNDLTGPIVARLQGSNLAVLDNHIQIALVTPADAVEESRRSNHELVRLAYRQDDSRRGGCSTTSSSGGQQTSRGNGTFTDDHESKLRRRMPPPAVYSSCWRSSQAHRRRAEVLAGDQRTHQEWIGQDRSSRLLNRTRAPAEYVIRLPSGRHCGADITKTGRRQRTLRACPKRRSMIDQTLSSWCT